MRYVAVFKASWQRRKVMDTNARTAAEAEFLPAALALQETPPPPAPRAAMWSLIGFSCLMLLWSFLGRVDVVAIAPGKVIPDQRSKVIQPLDTAVVKAILVQEGQSVSAGDLLIELDSSVAQADAQRVHDDWVNAGLQVARAQAMLSSLDRIGNAEPVLPQSTLQDAASAFALQTAYAIDAQRAAQVLLSSEWNEYQTRLARLDAERDRRQTEQQSLVQVVQRLERSLPLTRRRADDYKTLLADNFVSLHAHLDKEQARIEQEGELATARSRLAEVAAVLRELQMHQQALRAETHRIQLDRLQDGIQKREALARERDKMLSRVGLTALKSPVDGKVQQLAVHSIGGVVTPAQVLMVIVPDNAPVVIETVLENRDIGFVREGQRAEVKCETFPFTRYGTLSGTVKSVSADAVQDDKRGPVFTARIALDKDVIIIDGRAVKVSAGMAVSAEIKTGQRRVIEYFLSPLIQGVTESLRER